MDIKYADTVAQIELNLNQFTEEYKVLNTRIITYVRELQEQRKLSAYVNLDLGETTRAIDSKFNAIRDLMRNQLYYEVLQGAKNV